MRETALLEEGLELCVFHFRVVGHGECGGEGNEMEGGTKGMKIGKRMSNFTFKCPRRKQEDVFITRDEQMHAEAGRS